MSGLPRPGDRVDIRYRRPGRPTEVYRQRVLDSGAAGIVTFQPDTPIQAPLTVGGATILEPGAPAIWFTFPGLWHDIGLFHLADGTFTGLYANVLTPVEFDGPRSWTTTDLCLDVWVPPGGDAVVLDEADLDRAVSASLIDGALAARARREVEDLCRVHRAGTWPPSIVGEWSLERARARSREARRDAQATRAGASPRAGLRKTPG